MDRILLNELLKNGNSAIWQKVIEISKTFDKQTAQAILPEDVNFIEMHTSGITGNIATTLTNFYDLAMQKIASNNINQKVQKQFNKINEKLSKNLPIQIATMRDELELYLLSRGYKGDTFNLASHTLSQNLSNEALEMSNALNETIDTITNTQQQEKPQINLQNYN